MTIGQLKELLEDYDDAFEVRIAHQPRYPLQSTIAGVGMIEIDDDEEAQDAGVVYIAEGQQIGYASGRIWEGL